MLSRRPWRKTLHTNPFSGSISSIGEVRNTISICPPGLKTSSPVGLRTVPRESEGGHGAITSRVGMANLSIYLSRLYQTSTERFQDIFAACRLGYSRPNEKKEKKKKNCYGGLRKALTKRYSLTTLPTSPRTTKPVFRQRGLIQPLSLFPDRQRRRGYPRTDCSPGDTRTASQARPKRRRPWRGIPAIGPGCRRSGGAAHARNLGPFIRGLRFYIALPSSHVAFHGRADPRRPQNDSSRRLGGSGAVLLASLASVHAAVGARCRSKNRID